VSRPTGSLALTRLLKSLLFGVGATDPATMVTVAALPTGVASLACYVLAEGDKSGSDGGPALGIVLCWYNNDSGLE
jgi:hypothetical protein